MGLVRILQLIERLFVKLVSRIVLCWLWYYHITSTIFQKIFLDVHQCIVLSMIKTFQLQSHGTIIGSLSKKLINQKKSSSPRLLLLSLRHIIEKYIGAKGLSIQTFALQKILKKKSR